MLKVAVCSHCDQPIESGRTGGCLVFRVDDADNESFLRIAKAVRVLIEVRGQYCCACGQIDFDTSCMKVKRRGAGIFMDMAIVADVKNFPYCPECECLTKSGRMHGWLTFLADGTSPSFWRVLLGRHPQPAVYAHAQSCQACGWLGMGRPFAVKGGMVRV